MNFWMALVQKKACSRRISLHSWTFSLHTANCISSWETYYRFSIPHACSQAMALLTSSFPKKTWPAMSTLTNFSNWRKHWNCGAENLSLTTKSIMTFRISQLYQSSEDKQSVSELVSYTFVY